MLGHTFRDILVIALLSLVFCAGAAAQTEADGSGDTGWMKVRSDDGEFSVEIPAKYGYMFDKEGFSVGLSGGDLPVSNMHLLNSYSNGTLASFEVYDGPGSALDALYESDRKRNGVIGTSDIKRPGFKIKQIISRNDSYYSVRQYFSSKSKLVILTAASRKGETESMKRFLASVAFSPNQHTRNLTIGTPFSKLKQTDVILEMKLGEVLPGLKPAGATAGVPDPNSESFVIVSKPFPSYVDLARNKNVSGLIRLKVKLDADGFIPQITVIKTLPEGLLRQAIFAALRIKFLPKEVAGKPGDVVATFEYTFDIY